MPASSERQGRLICMQTPQYARPRPDSNCSFKAIVRSFRKRLIIFAGIEAAGMATSVSNVSVVCYKPFGDVTNEKQIACLGTAKPRIAEGNLNTSQNSLC